MKQITTAFAKALYLLPLLVIVTSCHKHDPIDVSPPPPSKTLQASLSLTKTSIFYDGVNYDSTTSASWTVKNGTSAQLNDQSVPLIGSITSGGIFTNTTYTLIGSDGKNSVTDVKTVQVTVDPQLALLGNGWWITSRLQYLDSTGWHDWPISAEEADNKYLYLPNRKMQYDFGLVRGQYQDSAGVWHTLPRYGYTDTAFTLLVQKNILNMSKIDWNIKRLTQNELVVEGYIPNLNGGPAVYSRETYVR